MCQNENRSAENGSGKRNGHENFFGNCTGGLLLAAALRVPCFAQEAFLGHCRGADRHPAGEEAGDTRAELAEILHRMMSPDARQGSSESAFRDIDGQRDGGLRLMLGDGRKFRPMTA